MIGLPVASDWLARLRVAGVEPMAAGLGVSTRQVRSYASQMEAEGLAVRTRLMDGGGAVLAITPRGTSRAGYEITSRTTTSSIENLQRGRGISWIAALCERRGWAWSGPDQLRSDDWTVPLIPFEGTVRRTHLPDLGFIVDGEAWAAQFERITKTRPRQRSILDGYRTAQSRRELEGVLFVCRNERIARFTEQAADKTRVKSAVRTLEWVIAETRGERDPEDAIPRDRTAASASSPV